MLVANTSSENLEMIEGVLASTMAEFLAVRSAGNTPEPAGTAEPAGPDAVGPQYSAVQETTSSGQEALQLHDTGALEDALERAEKRRVELAAKGMVRAPRREMSLLRLRSVWPENRSNDPIASKTGAFKV